MNNNLTSDTSAALLQASQAKLSGANSKMKNAPNLASIETAAQEFEAVFISAMMKPMFEGTQIEGTFGGGKGEEIFQGMILQEYGKMMSKTGSIGLASDVKAKLIEMQGLQVDQKATTSRYTQKPTKHDDTTMDKMAVKLNTMSIGE